MRVQVGPVSSGSVSIWVAYARTILAQALARPETHEARLAPDVIVAFEGFLDEWDRIASEGVEFVWVADLDAERIEYLTHAWFTMAEALAKEAEQRGFPLAPTDGEEFYQALVRSVIDALAYEGRARLEFSEQLREEWPGLKDG